MAFWLLQNISDCDKFSGKSIDYPDFLLNYEQSTQRLKSDPDMCLRILVSLLEGRALKLVKPFLRNRRRAEALQEALETLRLTYGTDRKQSRAQLDLLLGRPKVQATEAGLIDFYSELNSCWMVMQDCNRTKDLDAEHTLKSLFNKLPDYLQNKWDKEVDKSPDQMPTYKLLMKVVLEEHRRKRGDLNQWREETRGKKRDGGRGDRRTQEVKINAIAPVPKKHTPAPGGAGSPEPSPNCLCGPQGQHKCLANCPSYIRAPDVKARWELIQHKWVCFRCLHWGHKANHCPEGACGVDGCDRRHHATLHYVGQQPQGRGGSSRRGHFQGPPRQQFKNRRGGGHPPRGRHLQSPLQQESGLPGTNLQAPHFTPAQTATVQNDPRAPV